MENFFPVLIIMSLFCVGVFLSMQPSNIFAFLREPVVNTLESLRGQYKEEKNSLAKIFEERKIELTKKAMDEGWTKSQLDFKIEESRKKYVKDLKEIEEDVSTMEKYFMLFKPLVLCVWCFASFWGSIAFWSAHYYIGDFGFHLAIPWLLSMVCCIPLNALFDGILNKLNVY